MKKVNRISEAEWEVMEVVWKNGQLRASAIVKILKDKTSWSDKTIRTLIDRLVEKNVLAVRKEIVNVYYALIKKELCVREITDSFINRVYNGSLGLLVSNFVKDSGLKKEDIEILRELLKDKDKEDGSL